MSSEYLEVPLKPPSPPKHVLEVLKGYLLEHDERARMIGYLDGTDIPGCSCHLCMEAKSLLGASKL